MKRTLLFLLLCAVAVASTGAVPRRSAAPQSRSAGPRKQLIQPKGSGALQLPFSPGLLVGDTLYLSGVIGSDPTTGQPVTGGFEPEMRQAFANAQAVLKGADMDFPDVVSVTVYLADIQDFPKMNQIYREYFKSDPLPTRSTVAVKDLVRGARMEITMTAVRTKP